MAADEIHKGDIGTIFEVTLKEGTVVVDVSSATTKEIIFRSPSKVVTPHPATFGTVAPSTGDGVDGIIQYVTGADDLNEAGKWKIQARIVMPTGEWRSDVEDFIVYKNLDD